MYFNSYDSSGDPLSSLGVLIVVVYFAAYAIGFSTGRSRVFKWIAGGALVVFVFLFSQILDSSFGPFAGLFFLLILPVAGCRLVCPFCLRWIDLAYLRPFWLVSVCPYRCHDLGINRVAGTLLRAESHQGRWRALGGFAGAPGVRRVR